MQGTCQEGNSALILVACGYRGSDANCLGIDRTTGQAIYDPSNDPTQCNNLVSTLNTTLVSTDYEPYLGTWCRNISSDIVVFAGTAVNNSFANLLPPYVTQGLIEDIIGDIFNRIPCSFKPACLLAQRLLFCSAAFAKGSLVTIYPTTQTNLIAVKAHVPNLASRYLCHNFLHQCSRMRELVPELQQLNCSERIDLINGPFKIEADRFPVGNQTVAKFGDYPVESSANNASDAYYTPVSACPRGFSVPEDVDAPGQIMITGSTTHPLTVHA
jgi:hypothetical protein